MAQKETQGAVAQIPTTKFTPRSGNNNIAVYSYNQSWSFAPFLRQNATGTGPKSLGLPLDEYVNHHSI